MDRARAYGWIEPVAPPDRCCDIERIQKHTPRAMAELWFAIRLWSGNCDAFDLFSLILVRAGSQLTDWFGKGGYPNK